MLKKNDRWFRKSGTNLRLFSSLSSTPTGNLSVQMIPFRPLTFLLISAVAFHNASGLCPGVEIEVIHGASSLGTATPIKTRQSVQGFYRYFFWSYHGSVPTAFNTSMIFIHQDSRNCDLSLVVVHDKIDPADPLPGNWAGAVRFLINGDLTNAVVLDDPEAPEDDFDNYTYIPVEDKTDLLWLWSRCCTDGLADKLENPFDKCIIVTSFFYKGIDTWKFVSAGADIYLPMVQTDTDNMVSTTIEICMTETQNEDDYCDANPCVWWNLLCYVIWIFRCSF
jgi:hypothetical protein